MQCLEVEKAGGNSIFGFGQGAEIKIGTLSSYFSAWHNVYYLMLENLNIFLIYAL